MPLGGQGTLLPATATPPSSCVAGAVLGGAVDRWQGRLEGGLEAGVVGRVAMIVCTGVPACSDRKTRASMVTFMVTFGLVVEKSAKTAMFSGW